MVDHKLYGYDVFEESQEEPSSAMKSRAVADASSVSQVTEQEMVELKNEEDKSVEVADV